MRSTKISWAGPISRARAAIGLVALGTMGCSGVLRIEGAPSASSFLRTGNYLPPSGDVMLSSEVCKGQALQPEYRELDADSFAQFARTRGYKATVLRARPDLSYVDVEVPGVGEPVRFRVAVLRSPEAAGRELHEALLQHGRGAWGIRRANLAVLAPQGSLDEIVVFSSTTKLACWGVLTVAGLDDTYVVPGGYFEL